MITMRAFAATKAQIDQARTAKDRPMGRMADLVTEIEFAVAAEELKARG